VICMWYGSKLLAAALVGLWASTVTAQDAPIAEGPDSAFLIPRERLSTQATQPFLFLGEVMEPSHPQWSRYADVLEDFPDVSSCLVEEERDKPVQDVRKLDWARIDMEKLNVCVFRIAVTIDDPNLTRAWMIEQKYNIIDDLSTCVYSLGENRSTLEKYGECSEEGSMDGGTFKKKRNADGLFGTVAAWLGIPPSRHWLVIRYDLKKFPTVPEVYAGVRSYFEE
jgi:hypothetical protein